MKEGLIQFETVKLALEKGFKCNTDSTVQISWSQDCDYITKIPYEPSCFLNGDFYKEFEYDIQLFKDTFKDIGKWINIPIPTQSVLQKWLREEHEIIVFAQHETIDDAESAWTWAIKIYVPEGVEGTRKKKEYDFWKCHYSFSYENMMWWKTYEEALEDGLLKALKLIK